MIAALAYQPRGSALDRCGPFAASAYALALAAAAFAVSNPIVLAGVGAAVAAFGLLARATRALALALRWGGLIALLMVATNAIASQRGDTIVFRGGEVPVLGRIDVSAEALAEGAILGARVAIVIGAFAVFTASVDPDRLLRLFRPLARRSALTATLILRLVPLAAADHAAIREAAALRGPGAAPVGRGATARRLVAGSLERAVDVAATLELRGYSRGAPRRARRTSAWRDSAPFALAAAGMLAVVIGGRASGAFAYESYPLVSMATGADTLLLAAALPMLAAAPFAPLAGRLPVRRPGPFGVRRSHA